MTEKSHVVAERFIREGGCVFLQVLVPEHDRPVLLQPSDVPGMVLRAARECSAKGIHFRAKVICNNGKPELHECEY